MQKTLKKYFPVFLLPTLTAFAVSFLIPFIMGIYLSFTEFRTVNDSEWVGLANYIRIFTKSQISFTTGFPRRKQPLYLREDVSYCL